MKSLFLVLLVAALLGVAGSLVVRFWPSEEEPGFDPKLVRMEVVNGCGVPRLARAVAYELEAQGFDVYGVGNTAESHEKTKVVDLLDPEGTNAEKVARALSVQPRVWVLPVGGRVEPEKRVALDSARYLEVRLVVGKDYQKFFPQVLPLR
ncbi:MAG: LytR C-terminal domain-containing protein [candidate division WOR-3 bacterium]|nr:MAG: LytR C-terminal domain-containing protein [candidate division WOR-3 bacterium]